MLHHIDAISLLSPICQWCGRFDETDEHIIKCSASAQWRDGLYKWYKINGDKHKVDEILINEIIKALKSYSKDRQLSVTRFPEKYRAAIADWNKFDWQNWYKGKLAQTLIELFPAPRNIKLVVKLFMEYTITTCNEFWNKLGKTDTKEDLPRH